MPRKLAVKVDVPASSIPQADVFRVLEVNINNENGSIHIFYKAYESQDDIDVANPDYIAPVAEVLDEEGNVLVEAVVGTPELTETIKQAVPDVQVHTEGVMYRDADLYELATAATLDGETLYDAIKRVAYSKLEADGYFPSGGTDE